MGIESYITVNLLCDKCGKEVEYAEHDEVSLQPAEEKVVEMFGWKLNSIEAICMECQKES